MNKEFGSFLFGVFLILQLVNGRLMQNGPPPPPPVGCGSRLVCQSNNDPHMVNFWNQPFEFQDEEGEHCLYSFSSVHVSASFYQCPYPYLNAKCNCDVTITLSNGEKASISNCGNPSPFATNVMSLSSGPPSVTCQTVDNPLFIPLEESSWILLPVITGNTFFSCVRINQETYIKTRLSNSDANVFVKVTPGMDSVYVYASKLYQESSAQVNDNCLCERKFDYDITQYHEKFFAEMPEQVGKCKKILLDECFTNILQNEKILTPKQLQEFDNLILNCAFDLNIKKVKDTDAKSLDGEFQKNDIEKQIDAAVLEAFANPDNREIIAKFCECQKARNPEAKRIIRICDRLNFEF